MYCSLMLGRNLKVAQFQHTDYQVCAHRQSIVSIILDMKVSLHTMINLTLKLQGFIVVFMKA